MRDAPSVVRAPGVGGVTGQEPAGWSPGPLTSYITHYTALHVTSHSSVITWVTTSDDAVTTGQPPIIPHCQGHSSYIISGRSTSALQ